ncbi:UNVERIFIED_ORG: HK97 family phage major capsid protein [Heyndrickxia coagulans]
MLTEKITELRDEISAKKADFNQKLSDAQTKAGEGDLEGAKDLKAKCDELKAQIEEMTKKLAELEELANLQEIEMDAQQDAQEQEEKSNEKGEERSMEKEILNPQNEETRSFEKFIRTKGEIRDGLTTENADVLVPKEVVTEVLEQKQSEYDLARYVTTLNVGARTGSFPVAKRNVGILATKKELEEMSKVEGGMFIDVEYSVKTRTGQIALSNEVIEDAAIDVVGEVKKQLQRMVVNTNNVNIIELLKSFTKVDAATLDDVKKVFNVDLDPALNKKVLVNQSAFNYLDTLKDADGRYLLQPDLRAQSGKSLFGVEVIVVSDALLANGGTQAAPKYPIIVGDFEESVAVFNRNQVTAQWEKFDTYSQGLSIVVRNDYQKVDENATKYIELAPAAAQQTK